MSRSFLFTEEKEKKKKGDKDQGLHSGRSHLLIEQDLCLVMVYIPGEFNAEFPENSIQVSAQWQSKGSNIMILYSAR